MGFWASAAVTMMVMMALMMMVVMALMMVVGIRLQGNSCRPCALGTLMMINHMRDDSGGIPADLHSWKKNVKNSTDKN